MTIAYNHLNLPKTVTKGSDVLTYIYDAAGGKLAEKLNSTVNNFYTGAVVYKGDKTIDYIQTSTGIVRKVGADFVRQYNINDHLGNVRAVVNQSGTIEQANDYYPYGLAFNYNNLDKNRYLYNGKELQNQSLATTFFGVYDYGARYYDPVIGRWNAVDPMGEKYYNISPYGYCLNNPVLFIDPNGQEISIYYNDAGGNQQKLQYTQGMKYEGDNAFVLSAITALNQMNSTEIGGQVLGGLVGSKNQFNFTNKYPKNSKGDALQGTLSFNANEGGGGIINAAGLLEQGLAESSKLESTAHELFHGYQYEEGQGGASIMNEVEANLFGYTVSLQYSLDNGDFSSSATPLGRNNPVGAAFEKSFNSLIGSFSIGEFKNAVINFKEGSQKNSSGLYNNYPLQRSNQKNSMINRFYPLLK